MGVIVAGAGHRAHQGAHGPALGRLNGPEGALVYRGAVGRAGLNQAVVEGPVVEHELAFDGSVGQPTHFLQAVHFHHAGLQLAAGAHRAAQRAHRHLHFLAFVAHDFAALAAAAHPVGHHYLLQIHAVEPGFFHGGLAPLHGLLGLGRARQPRPDGAREVAQVLVALAPQQGFLKDFA